MMGDQNALNEMLTNMKKKPATIYRSEEVLEREVLDSKEDVVRTDKAKYVVSVEVVQYTKKYTVVREYDPELSYSDSLREFTQDK